MNKTLNMIYIHSETYDRIGYTWMPFIMFNQTPNFRSDVLNTDNRGLDLTQ